MTTGPPGPAGGLARRHAAGAGLAALVVLLAWNGGGFQARAFGAAGIVLVVAAALLAGRTRLPPLRSPAGLALVAGALLAAWTGASMLWAESTRHEAWEEAARTTTYLAALAVGALLGTGARAGGRLIAWMGAAVAAVGAALALRLATSDSPLRAFVSARLDAPVDYSNGVAALFGGGALLLLGLTTAPLHRRWRSPREAGTAAAWSGAALGAAGLVGFLAVLAQSRAALPALAIGALVQLALVPTRVAWTAGALLLGASVGGAAALVGSDVYRTQVELRQAPFTGGSQVALLPGTERASTLAGMAALGLAVVLAGACAALVVLAARARGDRDAAPVDGGALPIRERPSVRIAAGGLALILAAVIVIGPARAGTRWAVDQWEGCTSPPPANTPQEVGGTRFGETGTGRCDYYRVALGAARDAPVLGIGAGNFAARYVLERETGEEPQVAHSLPLQLLGELGIVGALLGAAMVGAVGWATVRYLRGGAARDPAFGAAVGLLAAWGVHASLDWLWQLPGVSLPVVLVAGVVVGCASPRAPLGGTASRGGRRAQPVLAAGAGLVGFALIAPLAVADHALREGRGSALQREDPAAALAQLDRAEAIDPTWAEPWIEEAELRRRGGDAEGAAVAARHAIELEPLAWRIQWRAAAVLAGVDDEAAADARAAALERNPQLAAEERRKALVRRRAASRAGGTTSTSSPTPR